MVNIETTDLTRSYETYQKAEGLLKSIEGLWARKIVHKIALHPTTIRIESGQIVGLVGSNGAGKTTLLKLLSGLIHPSAGTAKVLGYSPTSRDPDFLRRISILLGQKNQLWWDLPPADSYDLLAKIYELDRPQARDRVHELAELLDCSRLLRTQLRRLSLGERMKMEIIGALLHQPEVLFLDEPTIGLDIVAQTTIREFLACYVRERKPTLILTSHYMDDISLLADRLLLISKGQIVYDGSVQEFTAKSEARQTLSFKFFNPTTIELSVFSEDGSTPVCQIPAETRSVQVEVPASSIASVLQAAMSAGPIHEIKIEEVEFEDVIHKFMQQDVSVRAASSPPAI
ncbi:MAG: ATP-binding cassette domain-containing protein [Deltaproteobacteria bacterium]|jgi:ABC-2 type transport system ATP-binding protein|nr:ATP-binding cassette domain-containing protein [Deltaproteobacteria bacterium]